MQKGKCFPSIPELKNQHSETNDRKVIADALNDYSNDIASYVNIPPRTVLPGVF